ncbi:MAG: insulinase family protein [Cyanobacteria bacterium HKST-UBA04]|nr:insulinase family protein [Cyanobacteria bacterium HKST-UBA04]
MNPLPSFAVGSSSGLADTLSSVEQDTLSNGIRLVFKHMAGAPRLAFGVYVMGGNRIEPNPGVADIISDLLMEGTETRDAETISILLDSLSLSLETDTRRDYALLNGTTLAEDMDEGLELVSDMLFKTSMADFEKEKVRLAGELMMELDAPATQAYDLMLDRLLRDTPYQSSLANILKHVPSYDDVAPVRQHYQNVFNPNNILITVVGDCQPGPIKAALEKHLVSRSPEPGQNYIDTQAPNNPCLSADVTVTDEKPGSSQLHVFKGWFAPSLSHSDYPTATLIHNILGGKGLTSRLFLELRDKQGLAYHVRSQYEASRFIGVFGLYIGTEPSNRNKVLDGFRQECAKLAETPVPADELADAKTNLLGKKLVYLETAAQQCVYLGAQLSMGMTLDQIRTLNEQVNAVSAEDVQRVAKAIFESPAVTALVGPASAL